MSSTILIPFALCLAAPVPVPQDTGGGWQTLELPALSTSAPRAPAPIANVDGEHFTERVPIRESDQASGLELPPTILVQLLEDRSRANGDRLRILPGTPPLLVQGSDAALDAARAVMADIGRASDRLDVTVEAWIAPVGHATPAPPEAGAAGAESFRVTTRSGDTIFLGERQTIPFVSTYDVEVSSDSGIAEPVIGNVSAGRTLHVTTHRVDGGKRIYFHGVLDIAQLESLEEVDLETTDLGTLQRPVVAATTIVFSAVARPGEMVRVSVEGTPLDPPDWSVWLKAGTQVDPDVAEGDGLALCDLSFLAKTSPELPPVWTGPAPSDKFVGSANRTGFPGVAPTAIASSVSIDRSARSSSPAFYAAQGLLLCDRAQPSAWSQASSLVSAYESARLETARFELSHGSVSVHLPTTANAAARVMIGRETNYIVDYESEIAPEIWMPSPQVERTFDGIVLDAELASGRLLCAARVTRALGVDELPVEKAHLGRLQLPRSAAAGASCSLSSAAPERRVRLGSGPTAELSLKFLTP